MARRNQDDQTADAGSTSDAVASQDENARLEHSDETGGRTTRDDPADLGVPMLAGSASEPQGPEDALGPGPKRGDYSQRVGPPEYHPHSMEPLPGNRRGPDGATTRAVAQRPRASEQGEVEGEKGGVTTTEDAAT